MIFYMLYCLVATVVELKVAAGYEIVVFFHKGMVVAAGENGIRKPTFLADEGQEVVGAAAPDGQELNGMSRGILLIVERIGGRIDAAADVGRYKKALLRICHHHEVTTILQLHEMFLSRFPAKMLD